MVPVYKGKNWLSGAREFLKDPVAFTTQKQQELGRFYRVNLPFRRLYVATHPEVVKQVLQTNHRNYVKSPAYRQLKLALGQGLVTSEGDYWFRQRRLAQPAFYKKSLAGIFDKMTEVAIKFSRELEQKEGQTIDIARWMMKATSDIVLKALFSVENEADKDRMYRQIMDAQQYIMDRTSYPWRIPWMYLRGDHTRFLRDKKEFDEMAYRFIREHREAKEKPDDLLTLLIEARDADTGETMSDLQIRDEAITLFAAGHETSANALAWTFYLLSKHPQVLKKLRAEVKGVLDDRSPQLADLQNLVYTRQVIEESMRVFPPAYAVGRQAAGEDELSGEKIKPGYIIFISIYAIHHDPEYWENPGVFDPERFSPENTKKHPRFTYMPFGTGPRMCIGEHFAMMEMQLLLALLVNRFEFTLMEDKPVEYTTLVTLKPKNGIRMKIGVYKRGN